MIKLDSLITFASWEDRYYLGLEKNLKLYSTNEITQYYYKEYSSWTEDNRRKVAKLCSKKKITLNSVEIDAKSPPETWRIYENVFLRDKWVSKNVLVDISTMPRDSIWSIFYFLEGAGANVSYVYYKPKKYNEDWLSRDPEKPRLLFKHSGLAKLGYQTGLLIVTGFDPDRTLQLINFFEPKLILLGVQTGYQFESNKKNLRAHKAILKGHHNIKTFMLDAYSKDHGQTAIEREVSKYLNEYNMIMSSLGPKPSAVALYKVCRKNPQVALVYAPSKEFNKDYSHGIGRKISGKL